MIPAAMKSGAEPVKQEAIKLAPARTGKLKRSIRVVGAGNRLALRAGGARAFYARFQEFGTSKMDANPFLNPAMESKKPEALRRIQRAVDAVLGRVFGG